MTTNDDSLRLAGQPISDCQGQRDEWLQQFRQQTSRVPVVSRRLIISSAIVAALIAAVLWISHSESVAKKQRLKQLDDDLAKFKEQNDKAFNILGDVVQREVENAFSPSIEHLKAQAQFAKKCARLHRGQTLEAVQRELGKEYTVLRYADGGAFGKRTMFAEWRFGVWITEVRFEQFEVGDELWWFSSARVDVDKEKSAQQEELVRKLQSLGDRLGGNGE
ncbi:hypothetical protein ETAA8_53790 [Anatilimnocola aggregata]|uniref:Uncharacterized protein n=2 Tax=Anatilimnocola aggregata TaxID=2528021 RepID=A0A517YJ60_9BACT|nr:hypothetical protein ETAA8_53790 [Anatilimnocola aggregata]